MAANPTRAWRGALRVLLPVCVAITAGCGTRKAVEHSIDGGGSGGTTGGTAVGSGGRDYGYSGGSGPGGTGGAAGAPAPCTGPTDSRLVVAPRRVLRLTTNELLNTIRYLIDDTEAEMVASAGLISADEQRLFPPLQNNSIAGAEFTVLDGIAQHVGAYVQAHFPSLAMTLAGCAAVTDACATQYLTRLSARAYRRPLTAEEQTRLTTLYNKLRSQTFGGYEVPGTVEEATADAVVALLLSPQVNWRTEFGDRALASASPAGVPLSEAELATHLAFFLTDRPPDDPLLMSAGDGTLRANLDAHVVRLLATQPAKDWLRTIMETYYGLNYLPEVALDSSRFPIVSAAFLRDVQTESRMFLDNALWGGDLTDLLLSRTTFLNTTLASEIYGVSAPAGATATTFARTTLPADRRAGLLTNAGFLLTRARSSGRLALVPRAKMVASLFVCKHPPPPPLDSATDVAQILRVGALLDSQTGQQQVETRSAMGRCADCHSQFDPLGLALENYDALGRWIDTYGELPGMPAVDASTTLPAVLGGRPVKNGVGLAEALAASPAFTNCLASTLLQYALVDFESAVVETPLPPATAGCAAADVATRYAGSTTQTFSDLIRATAASPAFVLRQLVP